MLLQALWTPPLKNLGKRPCLLHSLGCPEWAALKLVYSRVAWKSLKTVRYGHFAVVPIRRPKKI
eukprot:1055382-Pelagomonas_calceolata.AAC.8